MPTVWEKYAPKEPAKTPFKPTATGQTTPDYEFGKQFVREDPEWYNFVSDPVFWLLEKINRPQQALFGYMDATLRGESSYQAVKDAFVSGKRTDAFKILDQIGLKGQAGHFDPVEDTIGVAMELFLDPANLVGVGPFKKFGEGIVKGVEKLGDVAGYASKSKSFMETIDKLGGIDKLVEMGVVPPGDLGSRVLRSAESMMGPDAYSHYLNLGWGKFSVSVPYSNVLLEKALIGPGKAIRKFTSKAFSTMPESQDEAILKALMDTSERVIEGVTKRVANVRRIVGDDWAAKLSRAVEAKDKTLLSDAPEKVLEAYEDLRWWGEYAPDVERLSGVMTARLGEGGADAGTLGAKLSAHGLDDEQSQLGYLMHAITKDTKKYLSENDIRFSSKKPKGWSGEFKPNHLSQLGREMPGDIASINSRYGPEGPGKFIFHPKGELESLYVKTPYLRKAIEDVAHAFSNGIDVNSKAWPRVRNNLKRIGEALGPVSKEEGPSFDDFAKWLKDKPEAIKEIAKRIYRTGNPYPDTYEKVLNAVKPEWGNWSEKKLFEMDESAYKSLWDSYLDSGNGQRWAKKLFNNASHRQKFDKFMEDDALKLLGARIGRHYRARVTAETIDQILQNPEWAVPIEKIPPEYTDDIVEGIADLGDNVDNIPDGFRVLDIGKIEKFLTPEFATRIRNTVVRNDMAVAIERGILNMFDVRETVKWLATARKIMGFVRASTILPVAGYHVANKAGNSWWRYVGGTLDIRNDVDAFRYIGAMFKNDTEALGKMTFKLGKYNVTGIELRNAIEQYDIATGGFLTEAASGSMDDIATQVGVKTTLFDQANPFSRKQFGGKVARGIEDEDRIAHFIGRLRNGDTLEEASKSVDTFLFRYSDLTEFESGTRAGMGVRDPFMFYTWYRKNLGLTLQKMWEYPGRLSMPIKIRNAFDDIFGDPDSEYAVPTYMRDQFFLYLGKDKEGKPRFLDPEKYLPPLSAAKFFAGGLKGVGQQIGSMLIPPLKAPLEIAMNTEFFSGRNIEGTPGQVKSIFGRDATPMMDYAVRNLRILNILNRVLFPEGKTPEGEDIRIGEPGKRTPFSYGKARQKEWGGLRTTTTDPQRSRYMEGISEGGRIGDSLNQIERKLNNPDISEAQRNSYLNERTKLLWEKAKIIGEMIDDGTDAFQGGQMKWVADKAVQGEEDKGSLRELYIELNTTLKSLYFGEPPKPTDHGIITVDPMPRLSGEEANMVYDMLKKVTTDMIKRDSEYALANKDGKYYTNNVLDKVRNIIRTEEFYSPIRIRQRNGTLPEDDVVIYSYPYEFRKALADSFKSLLLSGVSGGLIKRDSYRGMWERFNRDYGVDYR